MQPLGLIKCKRCGGKSYFSEDGVGECECYVGFAGMGEDCESYLDVLPKDVVIIYWEMSDETAKTYLEVRNNI